MTRRHSCWGVFAIPDLAMMPSTIPYGLRFRRLDRIGGAPLKNAGLFFFNVEPAEALPPP
jgi:hypothetical protein